ncbi:hypothetical protein T10_8312 [Trichinella papuae]|uniref:Uncharacterized protein n=1 Tax=Trichinella papuae TaxID=268474 RepID=A0A0V1MEP1_9BILA|nr:hypothetical protein T10_8312 [Trichinella papuae]
MKSCTLLFKEKYTNYQCSTIKKSSNHFHCRGQGFFNVDIDLHWSESRRRKKKRKKFIACFILEDKKLNKHLFKAKEFFLEEKKKQKENMNAVKFSCLLLCVAATIWNVNAVSDQQEEEKEIRQKRQFYHRYPPPFPPRMPPPRPFYPQGRYGRYGRYEVIRPMARYPGYMRPYF